MKALIYRFAVWLEYRALDLQGWAAPEPSRIDLADLVIGGINSNPAPFWKNATEGNAFLRQMKDRS